MSDIHPTLYISVSKKNTLVFYIKIFLDLNIFTICDNIIPSASEAEQLKLKGGKIMAEEIIERNKLYSKECKAKRSTALATLKLHEEEEELEEVLSQFSGATNIKL